MVVDVSATNKLLIKQNDHLVVCPANYSTSMSERNILSHATVHVHHSIANIEVKMFFQGKEMTNMGNAHQIHNRVSWFRFT